MYRVKETIYSHAHGKQFPVGAHVTERDFAPHTLRALLKDGTIEDLSQPVAEPEAVEVVEAQPAQATADETPAVEPAILDTSAEDEAAGLKSKGRGK